MKNDWRSIKRPSSLLDCHKHRWSLYNARFSRLCCLTRAFGVSLTSSFRKRHVIILKNCWDANFFSRVISFVDWYKRPRVSKIFSVCRKFGSSCNEMTWFFEIKITPVMLVNSCLILSWSWYLSLIAPKCPDILTAQSGKLAILATDPSTSYHGWQLSRPQLQWAIQINQV